jgi:hypothetical protein
MVSPLKPEVRRKAGENSVEYESTKVSLFHIHCTISALTVAIPATALRWYLFNLRAVPPRKLSFSEP